MDNNLEYRSIKDLLELFRNKMLTANPDSLVKSLCRSN